MAVSIINNHDPSVPNPEHFKSHLLDIIARGGEISKVIQAGSRAMGNPIHVLSASEELIARAGSAPENEIIWHMIENVGFPPLPDYPKAGKGFSDYMRVYNQLHHDHIDIRSSSEPVILPAVGARSRVMGINIKYQNRFAGNIYVLETNRPFCQADRDLLKTLSLAVSYLMMGDKFYQSMKGESHEYLLSQILSREDISREVIHDRVSALMPDLGWKKAVLSASRGFAGEADDLRTFRNGIENLLPASRTTIANDQVVVLIHSSQNELVPPALESEICKLLQNCHLRAGLSNTFTDAAIIREAYQQSRKAVHYGQTIHPERVLHRFLKYLPHYFLDHASSREDLISSCDPALIRIMEHDIVHRTEYTYTLNHYVLCVGNTTRAAAGLNIHYNTMKFRMSKINSFFSPGEISRNRMMTLYLSFRILELTGNDLYQQCMRPVGSERPR